MMTPRNDLVRQQIAQVPLNNRTASGEAFVRVGTTGSGDNLLVLRWTAADLARERAAGARVLGSFGLRAGMRVANTLAGALVSPGSLLLGDVVDEMGCLDVPLGFTNNEAAAKAAWELIDRVTPEVLVVDPASAASLLPAAPQAERNWLQGIVCLRTGNAGAERVAVAPAVGFNGWQRSWLAVAEVASFVAGDCAAGNYHLDPGVRAEVVDDRLLLTPVEATSGVTRYVTDIRAQSLSSCVCGGAGAVLQLA